MEIPKDIVFANLSTLSIYLSKLTYLQEKGKTVFLEELIEAFLWMLHHQHIPSRTHNKFLAKDRLEVIYTFKPSNGI